MRFQQPTRERARGRACLTAVLLFGLAPGGVYPATGIAVGAVRSYHTISPLPHRGGIFSVALSVGSRPPGVTWHPALWSPDFPLPLPLGEHGSDCPANFPLYYPPLTQPLQARPSRCKQGPAAASNAQPLQAMPRRCKQCPAAASNANPGQSRELRISPGLCAQLSMPLAWALSAWSPP